MSAPEVQWSARRPVIIGLTGMLVLILGIGGWSVGTQIEGAVLAPGTVNVESFRQVVQHLDGGTVAELNVREGDRVEAGQILIRLDEAALEAQWSILQWRLYELRARIARLEAERDGADHVSFPEEMISIAASDNALQDLLDGQNSLFKTRRETAANEAAQLSEKINQLQIQIEGLKAQRSALQVQADLITSELRARQKLLNKGLARSSEVMALRRESARLDGSIGDLGAQIAQRGGQIAETRLELLRLKGKKSERVITELRDLKVSLTEAREKLNSVGKQLARLDIRAPVSGVVHGLGVHTLQAVLRPAEPIMNIIPETSKLVIRVRVAVTSIDEVHVSQPVSLKFSAFNQGTTPTVDGVITRVSGDAFTDEASGISYYSAEVTPSEVELARLENMTLLPGMPVEAHIRTGKRTPLSYLLKPLTDFLGRSFRES